MTYSKNIQTLNMLVKISDNKKLSCWYDSRSYWRVPAYRPIYVASRTHRVRCQEYSRGIVTDGQTDKLSFQYPVKQATIWPSINTLAESVQLSWGGGSRLVNRNTTK